MRTIMKTLALLLGMSAPAGAQDVYLDRSLSELSFERSTPLPAKRVLSAEGLARRAHPTVRMDGNIEAWLGVPFAGSFQGSRIALEDVRLGLRLDAEFAAGQTLSGVIHLPAREAGEVGQSLAFTLDASEASPEQRRGYLQSRYLSCSWHLARQAPGGPFWRHLRSAAEAELAPYDALPVFDPNGRLGTRRGRRLELAAAYGLFTGGRALAENLRLNEVLMPEEGDTEWVRLDSLTGVTTPPVDWGLALEQAKPRVDALARVIPADQPVLFVDGVRELRLLLREVKSEGFALLEMFETQAEDGEVQARYEQQLAVELSEQIERLSRLTVKSLAVTASDPFLRTGTDVAILFETDGSGLLEAYVRERHARALLKQAGAEEQHAEYGGIAYTGVRSPGRELCSYLLTLPDGIVVVSNSEVQVRGLIQAALSKSDCIAALPEYKIYRARYPAVERQAFVLVSDDAIRRWAGPKWRIAAARRTRAAAVLADESARALLRDSGDAGLRALRARDDLRIPAGGRLRRTPRGASSDVYGTPEFLTPVVELEFDRVTQAEAQAYEAFRRDYERQWSDVFDPIGISLMLLEDGVELDLSVRPLARTSDYRDMIEMVGQVHLEAGAAVGGEQLMGQMVWALDMDSRSMVSLRGFFNSTLPSIADPLLWVGDHANVYLEDSPFWEQAANQEDPLDWIGEHALEMPIGIRIACDNPLQMALFMSGLRGFIEQSAPGMLSWETRKHGESSYVAVIADDSAGFEDLGLYYATVADALLISLRTEVLEHAIDRENGVAAPAPENQWTGDQAACGVTKLGLGLLGRGWSLDNRGQFQLAAWDALPLWDELRRRFPGEDPTAVWARYFPSVPMLQGGDSLRWNPDSARYESSLFGTPEAPRMELPQPSFLEQIQGLGASLQFEEGDGLRARASLRR
ncbi:MAG: hypothetical protein ACI9HE_002549 [Planctomycetota bacterium]|jgi:hypothetical protein